MSQFDFYHNLIYITIWILIQFVFFHQLGFIPMCVCHNFCFVTIWVSHTFTFESIWIFSQFEFWITLSLTTKKWEKREKKIQFVFHRHFSFLLFLISTFLKSLVCQNLCFTKNFYSSFSQFLFCHNFFFVTINVSSQSLFWINFCFVIILVLP